MNPEIPNAITRRDALTRLGAGIAAVSLGGLSASRAVAQSAAAAPNPEPGAFSLPALGYAYDALEPVIDARTMEIHYSKHHQGYVNNANNALKAYPEVLALGPIGMLRGIEDVPEAIRTIVRNNVGGHANHTLFWKILQPGGASEPVGKVAEAIDKTFGSFEALHAELSLSAGRHFGSGWGWLSVVGDRLLAHSTANQDSPFMSGATPILGIDVWEHAYYLNYQNRRSDYIAGIWSLINWDVVNANFEAAIEPVEA